jgi:hypothetical protein
VRDFGRRRGIRRKTRWDKGRKVGGHDAQKLWRLVEVGIAGKIVRENSKAGANTEATDTISYMA